MTVGSNDLVLLYMTCIRSILSYAVPVFYYALPKYLQNDLERVQKRALSIIFPGLAYNKALEEAGIQTISDYNESICDKTFKYLSNNTRHNLRKLLSIYIKLDCGFNGTIAHYTARPIAHKHLFQMKTRRIPGWVRSTPI